LYSRFRLKKRFRQSRLPNDAEQRSSTDGVVHWDRDGNGALGGALLQDAMAALLSHLQKALLFQYAADFFAR
jgi:hypothetical protein